MTFNEIKILEYIDKPLRHLDIADSFELLDSYVFIFPNTIGFNVSHLEIDNSSTTLRKISGSHPLKLIHNVDVTNLNDVIEIIKTIFSENSDIKCEFENDEINNLYRNINNDIKIGLLMTRFKNSNNWLELFIEENELELAPHKNIDDCLGHMLVWYSCED